MAELVPVARALYLCDYHVGYAGGKVDLYGLLNTVTAPAYPFTLPRLIVFAQLSDAMGVVPVFADIRSDDTGELVHATLTRSVRFPSRTTVVQLAITIEACRFPRPGLYAVELYCHNSQVCEATLLLL